ncbi:hypothetical protein JL722_10844 [Aureococcus anophagefferens]|nr:hypothetical protein JL722_10844 [Aureococcus anophagefferens]
MGVRTSPQADRLDEFMAADAGYVPPPRAARRAELVVGRLFQSTAWSEHDERRRVADFEALDHDLRAAIGIAVRDASAQTTADDERDALGLAAETLEPGGLGLGASEPAPVPAPAPASRRRSAGRQRTKLALG